MPEITDLEISPQLKAVIADTERILDAIAAGDAVSVQSLSRHELRFVIHGRDWDGYIDARLAHLVLTIQRTAWRLVKEAAQHNIKDSDLPRVKVKVAKGSLDISFDLTEFATKALDKMTGPQIVFTLCVGFALFYASKAVGKHYDVKERLSTKKMDEETKQKLANVIDRQNSLRGEYEQPTRDAVNMLEDSEQIELPGISGRLDKNQAKRLFPRRPKLPTQVAFVDGLYKVISIGVQDDPTAVIEIDNVAIEADIILGPALGKFMNPITEAKQQGDPSPALTLQVNIKYTAHGMIRAEIIGVGAPRDGSEPFSKVAGGMVPQ